MIVHIEFFGLPASGKTTLLESLIPVAATENLNLSVPLPRGPVTPKDKWNKLVRDVTSVVGIQCSAPNVSEEIWHAGQLFKQPTVAQQVRMYLNCLRLEGLVRKYRKIASQNDVIAFDQGLFQAVWSLALRADIKDQAMLERGSTSILRAMTKPDLVIFADTPPEETYRRLMCKPAAHGRFLALMKQDSAWMDRACAHLEFIWNLSVCLPGVQTFHWIPEKFESRDVIDFIKRCYISNQRNVLKPG